MTQPISLERTAELLHKEQLYEKTLCAILNRVASQDNDELINLIVNTMFLKELDERYAQDAMEGIAILSQHIDTV